MRHDYVCQDCCEAFESRASMSRDAKYQKSHRASCPVCGSTNVAVAAGAGVTAQKTKHKERPPSSRFAAR